MITNIERDFSHALILTKEDLTAIYFLLRDNYAVTTITAKCSEGTKFSHFGLSELLDYKNPSYRRIESLTFCGIVANGENCCVNIYQRSFSTCDFSITVSDVKGALKVADELGKILNNCKPWYSLFSRINLGLLLSASCAMWQAIYVWYIVLKTGGIPKVEGSPSFIVILSLTIPLIAFLIAFSIFANRGWEWIFPKVWISIGLQVNELEKRAKVRNYVIFGIIVALILGIVGSVIGNYLSPKLFQ